MRLRHGVVADVAGQHPHRVGQHEHTGGKAHVREHFDIAKVAHRRSEGEAGGARTVTTAEVHQGERAVWCVVSS